jgi:outer membrane protein assembly factor BamB
MHAPRLGACVALLCASLAGSSGRAQDWPQWRHDAQNTAATRLAVAGGGKARAWSFRAGSHVWGYQPGISVWSSPALGVVEGRAVVLVGSYDHNVYCLDALDGHKRWRFATGAGVYGAPLLWHPPAAAQPAAAAVAAAEPLPAAIVFASSNDRAVYALDAALGRRVWVHTIETWRPTIGGARLPAPALGRAAQRDALFAPHWVWDKSLAGHMQAAGVTAIDARTGQRLWTAPLGDAQLSSPLYVEQPVPTLLVASENGNLYALDADSGAVRWSQAARNAIKSSPALARTRRGPCAVIGTKHGFVHCRALADGAALWTFRTAHWVDGSAAVVEHLGRPIVLVGSYDTQLYALDGNTGVPIWSHRTAAGIYSSPAVLRHEGQLKVLFLSWDHHLHCLSMVDGAPLFSAYLGRPLWDAVTLGDSIWSSPAVASIGEQAMVYVGAYSGPFHGIPLQGAALAALARPEANLEFWVRLPLVLLAVSGVAVWLTRRERRARARRP